jgi:hypothetical protein
MKNLPVCGPSRLSRVLSEHPYLQQLIAGNRPKTQGVLRMAALQQKRRAMREKRRNIAGRMLFLLKNE